MLDPGFYKHVRIRYTKEKSVVIFAAIIYNVFVKFLSKFMQIHKDKEGLLCNTDKWAKPVIRSQY